MKTIKLLTIVGVALSFSAVAQSADLTANEIIQRNFLAMRFVDSVSTAELKLISAQNDVRSRTISSQSRLDVNGVDVTRLTRFTAPAEIAGISMLTVEQTGKDDGIWVYLPSMHRTRRIEASDKDKPFLGTDFSLGDAMGFRPEDWTYGPISSEMVDSQPCYVIDAKPASEAIGSSSGYSLRRMWIDKTSFVALKIETYDTDGSLLKRISASDLRLLDAARGRYQPMYLVVENVQTSHKTEIRFTEFKVNVGVAAKDLTLEALEMHE